MNDVNQSESIRLFFVVPLMRPERRRRLSG